MTDVVTLSVDRGAQPLEVGRTIASGAHNEWVAPNSRTLIADLNSGLAAGPYNAFAETSSGSSLTVTIDTGEAVVGGSILARDTTTDVALDASTSGQTVYVGWSATSNDTVIIGLAGAFAADDPRIPIWTYATDGSGVTSATDERTVGESADLLNIRYETTDGSGAKVDAAKQADTAAQATQADDAGKIEGRDIYVQSSEPSDWDDGDLWFEPQ